MSQMLRVLVVDDEALIRQGLVTRLDAIHPGMDIAQAQNGEKALTMLEDFRAQIVFVDIQMPEIDGLSLIERVQARWPSTQFIILTGYAEFTYAQRAIQLGVQDYLLKPISTRELSETLEKVMRRISDDLLAQTSGAEIVHLKSRLNSINLQQRFYQLIGDGLSPERAAELQKQIFPHQRVPLTLALLFAAGQARRGGSEAAHTLADVVSELLPDSAESDAPYIFPHYMNTTKMLYMVFPLRADGEQVTDVLSQLVERLASRGIQATAGVSQPAYVLTRETAGMAASALQRRLLYGSGLVYQCGMDDSGTVSRLLAQDLSDFQSAILINDFASAESILTRIFSPAHVTNAPRNYLWTAYLHVISTLSLNVGLKSADPEVNPLDGFDTREEFLQYLRMLLHSLISPRGMPEAKRGERIAHAIEYVRRHFSENLTVNSLSYQYALSPNYFSTVFKETTGMGLVNFLTNVRMENACYMLTHTDLSVGSIARHVGFADAQYFFQVFKKNVGQTPIQYRKQHAENSDESTDC